MREKLDIGRVAQGIADTYGKEAGVLLPAAFILFLLVNLPAALVRTSAVAAVVAALVALVFGFVGSFWYTGMVVQTVNELNQGRSGLKIGALFTSVGPRVAPLIGIGILAGIMIVFGLFLLIVPGLILMTWFAVIAPAIVIERDKSAFNAFGRSRELVRGSAWQVFAVLVLIFILNAVVSGILQGIGAGIGDFWGSWVGGVIASTLIAPIGGLAAAIMYFELKRVHGESGSAAGPPDPTAATAPMAPAGGPPAPGSSVPPPSAPPPSPPPQPAPPSEPPEPPYSGPPPGTPGGG